MVKVTISRPQPQDLKTDKTYLRNRKHIKHSETSKNEIFKATNLKVRCDRSLCHEINEGELKTKEVAPVEGIIRSKDSAPTPYNVEFDGSMIIARADLLNWKKKNFPKEAKKPDNLTPPAL